MICQLCGEPMAGRKRMYCDKTCRIRAASRTRPPRSGQCSISGCDQPHRARTFCSKHYRQWERANGRATAPSDTWGPRRQAAWKKRRALIRGAQGAEIITAAEIYERDDWTCQLCQMPVDATLRFPHHMSASLDHIIPVSVGGTHTRDNVQLAHFTCNASKGATLPAELARVD